MATPSGQANLSKVRPPTLTSPRSQEEPGLKEQGAKPAEPPALGSGCWSQSRGVLRQPRPRSAESTEVGLETWGRNGWIH